MLLGLSINWNHAFCTKAVLAASLRGKLVLAFRGAVIFSLIDPYLDIAEVGGSNPPGPTEKYKPGAKPGSFLSVVHRHVVHDYSPKVVTCHMSLKI